MRLFFGPPPPCPDFPPPGEKWHLIREPGPGVSPFFELPLSLGIGYGTFFLWRNFHGFVGFPGHLALLAPLAVLTLILHEFLHALGHPGFGLGNETAYGIWLSRMAFFTRFDGPLSRNRRLLITIFPLLSLTIVPLLGLVLFNLSWWPLSFSSAFNALFAARDLLNAGIIFRQVPMNSILRDQGRKTYWREDSKDCHSPEKSP